MKFLNPSQKVSQHPQNFSAPPENISTPPEKISPLSNNLTSTEKSQHPPPLKYALGDHHTPMTYYMTCEQICTVHDEGPKLILYF